MIDKIKSKKKEILIGAVFAIIFLGALIATYTGLSISKIFVKSNGENGAYSNIEPKLPDDPLASYNILLLGYGGEGHDGGNLTDVMMVANVNPKDKVITLISIPRDIWVELPIRSDIDEYFKINAAHAIGLDDKLYPLKEPIYKGEAGGGNMAKVAASTVIGMPIEYFVSVNFDGFVDGVDKLGGLDVDVPVAFTDNYYPIKGLEIEPCGKSEAEITNLKSVYSGFELEKQYECRYEVLEFQKGVTKMDGDTALKFVRSRHSDQHGGDFARSQRQQVVINAAKEKMLSVGVLELLSTACNFCGSTVIITPLLY